MVLEYLVNFTLGYSTSLIRNLKQEKYGDKITKLTIGQMTSETGVNLMLKSLKSKLLPIQGIIRDRKILCIRLKCKCKVKTCEKQKNVESEMFKINSY